MSEFSRGIANVPSDLINNKRVLFKFVLWMLVLMLRETVLCVETFPSGLEISNEIIGP